MIRPKSTKRHICTVSPMNATKEFYGNQTTHYKGLRYNLKRKSDLDRVLGQDSLQLLMNKAAEHQALAFVHTKDRLSKAVHTPEEIISISAQNAIERIQQCNMMQYLMRELEIPPQGMTFFKQTTEECCAEMLGLKNYMEYKLDRSSPVRLLWDGHVYKIEQKGVVKTLTCETLVIVGEWALGYRHFAEVSPWNNGTFNIFKYDAGTNDITDHPTAIIDHYLLFNCHFEDGVLFADDIGRFVEYQFSDIES